MSQNKLIVIADDDLDDQSFIREAFKELQSDVDIHTVENGLELIKWLESSLLENKIPNLILMDLNMPLLDGYGALTKIKKNKGLQEIPVCIISTSRFDYDRIKSKELGAKEFYTKPYKFQDYKDMITEIYSHSVNIQK